MLTQNQIADSVLKNVTTIFIRGKDGEVVVNYIGKKNGRWDQFHFKLNLKFSGSGYAMKYMKTLTQNRVKEDILKGIKHICIIKNRMVYSYIRNPLGFHKNNTFIPRGLNGVLLLEGM